MIFRIHLLGNYKVLNHKSIASTAQYAQLDLEVAIEAIQDYAKKLNV